MSVHSTFAMFVFFPLFFLYCFWMPPGSLFVDFLTSFSFIFLVLYFAWLLTTGGSIRCAFLLLFLMLEFLFEPTVTTRGGRRRSRSTLLQFAYIYGNLVFIIYLSRLHSRKSEYDLSIEPAYDVTKTTNLDYLVTTYADHILLILHSFTF